MRMRSHVSRRPSYRRSKCAAARAAIALVCDTAPFAFRLGAETAKVAALDSMVAYSENFLRSTSRKGHPWTDAQRAVGAVMCSSGLSRAELNAMLRGHADDASVSDDDVESSDDDDDRYCPQPGQ